MPDPSFKEIVDSAQQSIEELQDAEAEIENEIETFKRSIVGSPSQQDRDTIRDLRDSKAPILKGIKRLALVTLPKLDDTAEVKAIAMALKGISADLQAKHDRLLAFGTKVKKIGDALTKFSEIATKLDGVLKKKPA